MDVTTRPLASSCLEVAVDPRIELLSAVQSLGDWADIGEEINAWAKPDNPYRQAMTDWFSFNKDHPAVLQISRMLEDNFAFGDPIIWALHYGLPPDLTPHIPLDRANAGTLERGGGCKNLEALAVAFRDFAQAAKFQEFFASQKPFYSRLVASYLETSPGEEALALMEAFYGERKTGYSVIIAPMFGAGNFGLSVLEDAGEHIYHVGAPRHENGKYIFPRDRQQNLLFHEFSHPFTNPAVDSQPARRDKYAFLLPALLYKMEPQSYGDWASVMKELMNRTNEIRLMRLYGNFAAADALEKNYMEKGFYWLPYTLKRLEEYEADRSKYPNYQSFIGRMFDVLDETQPVFDGDKLVGVIPKTE